ncbi:LON peptidase N-terminal domain and RING finger protein 2-like [Galendromus occidentalis]|uniref:LON peptidase N-terminal domain and RING finger protein 2-like n=1 Tax=Galendromus occidentalis TaxID=34638 RepID=A0AAJ7L5Y0_9ACAR|nr:LON peptidase N-terminal domain and RING finger protein 2-like [Galendromus occidentalis]
MPPESEEEPAVSGVQPESSEVQPVEDGRAEPGVSGVQPAEDGQAESESRAVQLAENVLEESSEEDDDEDPFFWGSRPFDEPEEERPVEQPVVEVRPREGETPAMTARRVWSQRVASSEDSSAEARTECPQCPAEWTEEAVRNFRMMAHYKCAICFLVPEDPQTTKCGHLFCFLCLAKALRQNPVCPTCRTELRGEDAVKNLYLYGSR